MTSANIIEKKINSIIAQLEQWCITTPTERPEYLQSIKKFKNTQKLVNSPGAKPKAIRDIKIVSSLAAYLMAKLSSRTRIDIIGWFSDRDAMLNFKSEKLGHYMFDSTIYLHHALITATSNKKPSKICFGIPELEGKMWYDSLIRVPDLLAGNLADHNRKEDKLSHEKYSPIVRKLFTAEKRNIFFRIDFSPL